MISNMMMNKGGIFAIVISMACSMQAAILVVDQDPSNQAADYEQLQPAIDAAQDGDTIYVMPSASNYEAATVNKSLTLIGSGTHKSDAFPSLASLPTIMDQIIVNANDVFLTGFDFHEQVRVLAPSQNVTIFRCYFNNWSANGELEAFAVKSPEVATKVTNLHVINNRFTANSSSDSQVDLFESTLDSEGILTEMVGFVFANNIIWGGDFSFPNGEGEIFNNYFDMSEFWFYEDTSSDGRLRARGNFYNNIVWSGAYREGSLGRRNNAYSSSNAFAHSSNFKIGSRESVMVWSGTASERYVLTDDSALKGAGMNGEDIGIYGGLHAWNPNYQPPIPIITKLQAPRIVGAGETLSLQIEVQPNN
jgi:hypothetical protein